jgi:hypothetical protein
MVDKGPQRESDASSKSFRKYYPDRFVLGLDVSHRLILEMRGHDYHSLREELATWHDSRNGG